MNNIKYHDFVQSPVEGSKFSIECSLSDMRFGDILYFLDDQKNIPFLLKCIEVSKSTCKLKVSQKKDDHWYASVTISLHVSEVGKVEILGEVLSDCIRLTSRSGSGVLTECDFPSVLIGTRLKAAEGNGAWKFKTYEESAPGIVIASLESEVPRIKNNFKVIFDIGMHNGDDTDFYLRKGFGVVAVEANPLLATACARRFKAEIEDKRLIILNIGLGNGIGTFPFFVNKIKSQWSSFDQKIASRGHPIETINVRMYRIDDLFEIFGVPYYIKIDIEGNDSIIVQQISNLSSLSLPKYVSVENGGLEMLRLLIQSGYSRFKYVDQSQVFNYTLPLGALEGEYVAYRFSKGASGPFGEEAPGKWISSEHIIAECKRITEIANNYPDIWFDLHACRD